MERPEKQMRGTRLQKRARQNADRHAQHDVSRRAPPRLSKSIPSDEESSSQETSALDASFETTTLRHHVRGDGDTSPSSPEALACRASFGQTKETEQSYKDNERRPFLPGILALDAASARAGMYEDKGTLLLSPEVPGCEVYATRVEETKTARKDEN